MKVSSQVFRNLVLVHRKPAQDIADFEKIHEIITERAPDIEVFIVNATSPNVVTRQQAADRPTLVFSPLALDKFKPLRGKIYCGESMAKIVQGRALKRGGLLVPDTIMLERYTRLDPETWGPFTILKPDYGYGSRGITLVRTRDVQWVDPLTWPKNDPRYGVHMIAQKFIDTGQSQASYRLLTLFGRVLYCEQYLFPPRPALDPEGTGPLDIFIAYPGNRGRKFCYDEDVLALGPAAAKAFPDIPVLGLDVMREEKTGDLYVLEVNPGGDTWHLSSPIGKKVQKQQNINRYAQFDALSVAADALIEKTRAEAE